MSNDSKNNGWTDREQQRETAWCKQQLAKGLNPSLIYPVEITPALQHVLGLMNFQTCPLAHVFREAGHQIPNKIEDEHAFILHRIIKLVLEHGAAWQPEFGKELTAAVDTVKAQRATAQAVEERMNSKDWNKCCF